MIAFNCPTCGKHFKLSDRFAGRNLFCSGCKTEIFVPQPENNSNGRSRENLPQAVPDRSKDAKIGFDCAECGKHYSISPRFSGRIMICSGCKNEFRVPRADEISTATFSTAGEIVEKHVFDVIPSVPLPPPLPGHLRPRPSLSLDDLPSSREGFSSSSGYAGVLPAPDDDTSRYENAVAARTGEDSAILAYVYAEKHEKRKAAEPAATPQLPLGPVIERKPVLKRNLLLVVCMLAVLGAGVGLFVLINPKPEDRRPALLAEIAHRKTRTHVEAGKLENEAEHLRMNALEAWNAVGALIDNGVVTVGEKEGLKNLASEQAASGHSVEDSINAVRQRFLGIVAKIPGAIEKAASLEKTLEKTEHDSRQLQAESLFYAGEETKLAERIRIRPDEREDVAFPHFQPGRESPSSQERIVFDRDWTENDWGLFGGVGVAADRFFMTFDGARRQFGSKSLRITSLEKEPLTIVFPANVPVRRNCDHARGFVFSIRFPDAGDRLHVGDAPDSGKIGEYRIRFINSSGHVDFQTDSARYCEAVYYDARNRFVTVGFPLEGNEFWRRSDHFDLSKRDRSDDRIDTLLSGEEAAYDRENDKKDESFFSQIDKIEFRLTPLSNRTTFWIDGIALTEKDDLQPYDLERAESMQAEIRRRDRLAERPVETGEATVAPPEPPAELQKENASEEPLEFAGTDEQRLRKFFVMILQEFKGRIRADVNGQQRTFGPKSPIPDSLENVSVEEIDLSRARNLTGVQLDQLGRLEKLKKLNLSHTGLKDADLMRLSTLFSLESLNLAGNDLSFEGIRNIKTLQKLRELNLDGIRSSVEGIVDLGNMTGLKSLSLSRSNTDSNDLIYLLTLMDLETLDLSASKIGDRALATLRAFPSLQSLNIAKTRVTDAGIAQINNLHNLRSLNLDETAATDACLKSLGKLEKLEAVSALKTKITREGIRQHLGAVWVGRFNLER